MPELKFTRSQQRAESKRKADEGLPSERPMKLSAIAAPSDGKSRLQATGGQSQEALFKARHPAEFDDHSVGEGGSSQAQVKRERHHGDEISTALTRPMSVEQSPTPGIMSPLVIVPTPRNNIVARNDNQDDVIVAILSQDTWDEKMTNMTVDTLSERARRRAGGGDLFDRDYLIQFLHRLDNAGISAERRSEVVHQLQSVFRHFLSHWNACVERLGGSASAGMLPHNPLTETVRSTPLSTIITPSPLKRLDSDKDAESVDVPATRETSKSLRSPQDSGCEGARDRVEFDHNMSQRDGFLAYSATTLSAPSSLNVPLIPRGERSVNNKRIYGTVCPKAAFDIFARSVIATWGAAPSPEDNPTRIHEYAKPVWQSYATLEQKDEWYKVYEARKDPFIDVTAEGAALLLSQDLLAKVVPGDRFAAAKLLCQQHQRKLGAIVSSTSTMAKKITPPSPPRATFVECASVSVDPVHQERISGPFVGFPRMLKAVCDLPKRQACLVPSAAQKQNLCICVFVVNTPDVRTSVPLTEADFRSACRRAQIPGLKEVWQESFNVFLASFRGLANADKARRKPRLLQFALPSTTNAPSRQLHVGAEYHWHEVNRIFVYDVDRRYLNHSTVGKHVFDALEGPLALSFRLFKQEYREQSGRLWRTRYLLRPSEAVSPVLVERFYFPLNAAAGKGRVWGIFKPVNRHWKCPACHKRCQSGDVSACEVAVELHRDHSDG